MGAAASGPKPATPQPVSSPTPTPPPPSVIPPSPPSTPTATAVSIPPPSPHQVSLDERKCRDAAIFIGASVALFGFAITVFRKVNIPPDASFTLLHFHISPVHQRPITPKTSFRFSQQRGKSGLPLIQRSPRGVFMVSIVTTLGGYAAYDLAYRSCRERAVKKPASDKTVAVIS
ncbi:uncharacterized protein EV422DRAFT_540840 [Fimicolochytrium jonesii]|uniref:uncharacterized protein n=1 Tax=Fimicolochytrium jonesii TaxID=1396493 RepID=UPI0022FE3491|nr:uncharacterized protein EV422DRAFT_540840 [Fimicolochytrium jonesii]KAI8817758.1 hypothetical protein EV422DRAFT_540840 [Fimicolochytrium jonesii]